MLLVKRAVENGELRSDISMKAAALFTKSILESLGRLWVGRQVADPFGQETVALYNECIFILRNGLAAIDY